MRLGRSSTRAISGILIPIAAVPGLGTLAGRLQDGLGVEYCAPRSFRVGAANPGLQYGDLFFSFATLTTVGDGDVLPMTGKAGAFARGDAMCGVMDTPVLMAHLVSALVAAQWR